MTRPLVFMIDDNTGEIEFAGIAFEETAQTVELEGFSNADEALERLRALGADPTARLPQLILLDLNMPRVHGTQILAYLQGAPRWREVPVVVLTTSDSDKEREQCLVLGATEFQVKPPRMDAYLALFRTFHRYLGPRQDQAPPPNPSGPQPPPAPATPPPGPPTSLARWWSTWAWTWTWTTT